MSDMLPELKGREPLMAVLTAILLGPRSGKFSNDEIKNAAEQTPEIIRAAKAVANQQK